MSVCYKVNFIRLGSPNIHPSYLDRLSSVLDNSLLLLNKIFMPPSKKGGRIALLRSIHQHFLSFYLQRMRI